MLSCGFLREATRPEVPYKKVVYLFKILPTNLTVPYKMRKIYFFFILVVFAFSFYVAQLNFSLAVKNIDWLKVKKVRFYGLKSIQAKELMNRIGLNQNTSLVFLNKEHLKKVVETDKRLKVESIDIQMPDTLEMHLTENAGVFLYRKKKNFYSLDNKGNIISSNEGIYFYDLPILTISKEREVKDNEDDELLKNACRSLYKNLNMLPETERDFKGLISEIDISSKVTFYLRNGIKVFVNYPVTLKSIRKARYGILYALEMNRKVDIIDTRGKLVRYRLKKIGT